MSQSYILEKDCSVHLCNSKEMKIMDLHNLDKEHFVQTTKYGDTLKKNPLIHYID